MDYDLARLGPTEFEHMVQALAIAELGIRVSTFGAGRDGGREATFSGAVSTPDESSYRQWDGYGIVQAKTIRFEGTTSTNATSIASAVTSELDRFIATNGSDPERDPAPQYYIIATNVRLTPFPGSGGLDQVEKVLREHPVRLAGFAVWHYEHICRLLDRHTGIRRTFAGFITPGDVLTRLIEVLEGSAVELGPILRGHAAAQVMARQELKLDTGEITDVAKVQLSDVAIDLPAKGRYGSEVQTIQRILQCGDHSLRASHKPEDPYGFVVIGGPGQGKSTLGQIVAQSYRVALLQDETVSISPRIDAAIADTRRRISDMGLAQPRNRRWPVTIDIASFADAISENGDLTIVEYIARQLRNQAASVTAGQLVSWLAAWPWVLIFDGLDEVPAPASRSAVVQALNDLIIESRVGNWDVLIVATTRPQGYENEFDELRPERLELRSLTPSEGFEYGRQIIATKFTTDPERISALTDKLREASVQNHAAKLMTTPLQVSIMEFLVEELFEVPRTRHELFDGYYKAIYSRESRKAGRLGRVLRTHEEQVAWVHERVAVGLQAQLEHSGETVASLPDAEVRQLIAERLKAQQYDAGEVDRLSDELEKATKQRLVLLIPKGEDRVEFEVRSLQEYMAARWLVKGDAHTVFDRLSNLAPSAYWRNTWLLAAGRFYGSRDHERDAFIERLRQLDSDSLIGGFLGFGAQLSVELLDDNFASSVPAHRRSLLALAMTQSTRWPGPDLKKLARLARDAVNSGDQVSENIVLDALADGLDSTGRSHLSAVSILQHWKSDRNESGRFARSKLENIDLASRPKSAPVRQITIGALLDEYHQPAGAASKDQNGWKRAREVLDEIAVPDHSLLLEAVAFGNAELEIKAVRHASLEDPAAQEALVRTANKVPISRAAAPILLRRLLLATMQSTPRGHFLGATAFGDISG
ncbi:NACHT domain-containing protein [Microbacterium murale]|uniref:Uncharacterized protein n=1 Tax=Microbacterium murale TaxID=1081040 RepID=A0ABQ1RW91_9MICO|nr:hypothetical protein [Microbacterium murale]GGD84020.1 hypothetical protein GCM10007269_28700 [Microbacterium murale]